MTKSTIILPDLPSEVEQDGTIHIDTLEKYDHLRVAKESDILPTEPMLFIGGGWVAARKNITAISADAKAGKSAILNIFQACFLTDAGTVAGFPQIVAVRNTDRKCIISFDTEQADMTSIFPLKKFSSALAYHKHPIITVPIISGNSVRACSWS